MTESARIPMPKLLSTSISRVAAEIDHQCRWKNEDLVIQMSRKVCIAGGSATPFDYPMHITPEAMAANCIVKT
jgi:hypothetical protein